jgi:HIV Tat-specific factor 1
MTTTTTTTSSDAMDPSSLSAPDLDGSSLIVGLVPASPPSSLSPLDERLFYYQHPKTGNVSSSPLTLRQLCRLLVPVREGLAPILAPHTRFLQIKLVINPPTTTSTNGDDDDDDDDDTMKQQDENQQQQEQQAQFGDWKLATEIEILQEAACAQWFYSTGGSTPQPEGPVSCRTLLAHNNINNAQQQQQQQQPVLLVYAQDLTNEWTKLSDMSNLQLVLQALDTTATTTTTTNTANNTTTTETAFETNEGGEEDESSSSFRMAPNDPKVQEELEEFLASTANDMDNSDEDANDAGYESDGGTKYVKDPITGNWIHEALAPRPPPRSAVAANKHKQKPAIPKATATTTSLSKKRNKGAKFAKKNAKFWVYVTGLPTTVGITVEDVARYFSKAGLLDLDPETLSPKVKLYKDADTGNLKGDASICYARAESIDLALQLLDESPWDATHTLSVQRAKFEAKKTSNNGEGDNDGSSVQPKKRRFISEAKRKVAKLALLQAQDEGFGERLSGGRKGLRIVVVQHMVDGIPENKVEDEIQQSCQEFGPVEKITFIEQTKTVIIKFAEPTAASNAVQEWQGKLNPHSKQKIHAVYWDGVTDYTSRKEESEVEATKRHEDFGNWIENQELPPEFQLKVEGTH